MSRATRVEFPGAIYHAMGRAMGGVKAFTEDEQRERFLESIGQRVESGDLMIKGPARSILAALLVSRTGLRSSEVARRLGVSRSAITKSVLRVDETVRCDPVVAKKIRVITASLLKGRRGQS